MYEGKRQKSEPTGSVLRFPVERTEPARLLTLADLRERFGYSERWWRYRIAAGLPCHRWGGGLRFDAVEVAAWLDAHADALSSRDKAAPATGKRPGAWPRPTRRS